MTDNYFLRRIKMENVQFGPEGDDLIPVEVSLVGNHYRIGIFQIGKNVGFPFFRFISDNFFSTDFFKI